MCKKYHCLLSQLECFAIIIIIILSSSPKTCEHDNFTKCVQMSIRLEEKDDDKNGWWTNKASCLQFFFHLKIMITCCITITRIPRKCFRVFGFLFVDVCMSHSIFFWFFNHFYICIYSFNRKQWSPTHARCSQNAGWLASDWRWRLGCFFRVHLDQLCVPFPWTWLLGRLLYWLFRYDRREKFYIPGYRCKSIRRNFPYEGFLLMGSLYFSSMFSANYFAHIRPRFYFTSTLLS